MGVYVQGTCDGCHRTSKLVVEERYCSEACKERFRRTERDVRVFACGVLFTLLFLGIIFAVYYTWNEISPSHWSRKVKATEQMMLEQTR